MLKVITVVGTRPELIKMSQIIPVLDQNFNHILVHTGQNYDYELNDIFYQDLGIRKPDLFLESAGASPMETVASTLVSVDKILKKEKPDAFVIYGDTNSCLSAMSAKRLHIPIFHLEAGNRSFDQRVPEEMNRKVIDHISDINFPLTEHARQNLLREGIYSDRVIKIGSCMKEVYSANAEKIENSKILDRLCLTANNYILFSAHREENVDRAESIFTIVDCLDRICEKFQLPVVFSTHPRTRKSMESKGLLPSNPLVKMYKPFSFSEYNKLQLNSFCTISDSGTITEESSLLGFNAITLREAHERPEGMESGVLTMSSLDPDCLIQAIEFSQSKNRRQSIVPDYQQDSPSWTVANVIMSYTKYVKRTVWFEK